MLYRLVLIISVASLFLSACRPEPAPPTAAPATEPATPQPTTLPTPGDSGLEVIDNGSPLPPKVVEQEPQGGQELPVDSEIWLTFDQAMDETKTSGAWSVVGPDGEAVQGKISWTDNRTLHFKPSSTLKTSSLYTASLGAQASSAEGVALVEPYDFQFITIGELQVSQVFPGDGAEEVASNAVITVIFNRPVVPLVISEEQSGLPQPLEIEPPIPGKGEWVNTSVYAYQPSQPLQGGTTYQATVQSGLADATEETQLAEDFAWKFTTTLPMIESFELSNGVVNPNNYLTNVLLDEYFTIRFLQPMDPASTEAALSLNSQSGEKTPFVTDWNEDFTTIVFTPTQRLALDTDYALALDAQAQAANGGSLKEGLTWNFTTIPAPRILSTRPEDGSEIKPYSGELFVQFASPMRIDTVKQRIIITPPPKRTVEWWYNEWEWSITSYALEPSTEYEVHFLPGMQDIYGNSIRNEKVIHFKTAAYEPSANLLMPYEPAIMRAEGPPETQQFYVESRNTESIQIELHRLTTEQAIAFLSGSKNLYEYNPPDSTLVWQVEDQSNGDLNQRVLKPFQPTTSDGEALPPGFYFLGLNSPQVHVTSPFADHRMLIVANANLTFKSSGSDALLWLTDLESGQPLSEVSGAVLDKDGREIGQGNTDTDGMLYLELPSPDDPYTSRFALADDGQVFAFASSQWGSGFSLWDYGIWSSYYAPANQPTAYVYTERPIYRPGQPVYFKGIVRLDNDLDYQIPDMQTAKVKIVNVQETVYEDELPLSSFGSFDGKLDLDQEAILGYYTLEVYLPGREEIVGSVTFNVAEYRRPEYQVKVSAEPTDVLAGENFTIQVQADYYSGGGVADAEVSWTLTAVPFYFSPPEEFSSYNFADIEEDVYEYRGEGETTSEVIAEGKGQTDAKGSFSTSLPADLSEAKTSLEFTFEATVTDISKNAVSGRTTITAHRSAVYPGARPQSYVGIAGEEQSFEFVALDWDGNPLAGQKLSIEIVERRWYSVQEQDPSGQVQWTSTVEEIPITSFDEVTTDSKGEASVTFTPPNGGIFRARVSALDAKGNLGSTSAYMWVAGEAYIPWRQTNDRSFDLVSDQKNYEPGDTAEVLIASPFQGESTALVTVERGRIHRQEVVQLTSNSTIYKLPITPDMAPNAYISVVVVKGVDETNPRPNFKMGMLEIGVDTRQQTITVELEADRTKAAPGEQVTYTVRTRDYEGEPLSAEVSLSLSDLATLSLMPPNSPPILEHFYSERTLGVWTSMPISLNLDEFNVNIEEEITEGRGGGSGGAKGEGDLGVVEVRQEFPDTAFWEAYVQTNMQGEATVVLTLPDNLTTWRMDARAVTQDTRVGQITHDLISTKDLLVRPQTPRFFIVNDQVRLGAAVQNNTDQAFPVEVSLQAEGLTLQNPASQTVQVAAKGQVYVSWEVMVDSDAQRVDLVFSAEGGGLSDASRPPLGSLDNQGIPVYRYEARETVGTSGQMTSNGTVIESISLPQSLSASEGDLTIKVSPSLAAGMTDGLTYLEQFPYDCAEQIISRFLPNVVSTRALKEAGLSDPELEAELKNQVETTLQRLYKLQNPDGGWGWWGDQKSDPLTSAYVVLGLVEAQAAQYTVSEAVLERGQDYLQTQVISITGLTDPEKVNRQAFILYVLASAGQPNVSKTVQLYDQRQRMALYARAFLTHTLYLIDSGDPRLETLLSDFANTAILSATGTHWEEKTYDRWNWNTNTRSTAIILSVLSLIDASNPLNANAVRWLMSNRTDGHWYGTQETAWTLMGLTNWMVASGELQANYEYAVALNNERLGGGVANSETLRQSLELRVDVTDLLKDQANRLAIARQGGSGNLYYTAHLNVSLPVDQIQPLEQGISVSRSYYRLDDLNNPVTQAQQGELLLVRLTIVAPHDLHNVVIDDPLPAGLEAVDQSLSTSPQSVEVPQEFSWEDVFWLGWGWWFFTQLQLHDEKAVLSATSLPAGTYIYTYLARAGSVGQFQVIPTTAQEFYFPEVYGRGAGSLFTINP